MPVSSRNQLVAAAALLSLGGILLALVYLADMGFYPIGAELALFGSAIVVGTLGLVVGCRWRLVLGRRAWTAVGVGAAVSVLLSYFVVEAYGCCALVVHRMRGFPFAWLDDHQTSAEWRTVDQGLAAMERHPEQVTTTFSAPDLGADLVFWAYVLIVLALVGKAILSGVRRPRSGLGPPAPRVAYPSPGRR